ncbi:MAG: hypothetical protein ACSLE1_05425 [Sphingobium sp.]
MNETVNEPKTDIPVSPDETWIGPHGDQPIGEVFSRLIGSGKEYAQAELDKQRLRAAVLGTAARDAAMFGVVALVIFISAIGALLVGLIITLSPALSPGWATAVVVVTAFVLAGLLLLVAKSRVSNALKALKP